MRIPSALILLVPMLLPAQNAPAPAVPPTKPEDLCTLSGRVLNASSGEPVRRVTVVLMRADPTPGEPPLAYTTASDAQGGFAMKDVEPGKYRLTANRNGFVNFTYGARSPLRPGTTLSLARRQNVTELTLKMTPHAVITGRIVDEEGEPVPQVQLSLQGYRYLQGRRQLLSAGGVANTNDLGEYRIFGVAPGKFYLSAMPYGGAPNYAVDRSTTAAPEETYAATFYPGTTDAAGATQLDVPAGAQLRGIDMVLKKTRTVHIKGHVTHGLSGRVAISVLAIPRSNAGFMPGMRNVPVDAAGNFDIRNVTPGSYTVTAVFNDGAGAHIGRAPVDVGTSNIEGVQITLSTGLTVKGRVRSDPEGSPVDLSNTRVGVQAREPVIMFGGGGQMKADDQGNFELKNIAPDRYNISATGLPSGAYVKSVRSDQIDVLAAGLDLSGGAPPAAIDIVISSRGATVTGTVQNEKTANPAPGATVVLIPEEKERRDQQYYVRNVAADQQGAFSLTGVPPGAYRLYAWEDVETGAWSDPDFMKAFDGKGESVTLREGDQKPVPLKLIPVDAP
jgi:protocatechuate 3,4-dioxygenase beta subunit